MVVYFRKKMNHIKLKNKAKIETWFPTSVYVYENLLSLDYLEDLYKQIIHLSKIYKLKRTTDLEVDSIHTIKNLTENSNFDLLKDYLTEHSKIYAFELGYSKDICDKLFVEQIWFNISKKEDFLMKHIHPGSILSGAFYIKSNKEDRIRFYAEKSSILKPTDFNNLSYEYCDYKCDVNSLLLFKSDLYHSTNKANGEKVVISFNINLK
jgi:uncharacterized protein (TIGR02466 family)